MQIHKRNRFIRREFYNSLGGKLIIIIGISTVALSSIFWLSLVSYQKREIFTNTVNYGLFFGEHVKKSTRYGMLIFHTELIQKTIEDISSIRGVRSISIFDKTGRVKYSSVHGEVGGIERMDSPDCMKCHLKSGEYMAALSRKKWIISDDKPGVRALKVFEPIYNEPACYTADCHVHSKTQRILGVVKCTLSLASLDAALEKQQAAIGIYVFIFTAVTSSVICLILRRFVSKPVELLIEGMEKAGRGDLEHVVKIDSRDEMGVLAEAFNAMKTDLRNTKEYLASVETEKLAFLGRMAAGVAHEINNPLTGVMVFAHLMLKRTSPGSDDRKDLEVIIEQADRCKSITKGLLDFARSTPMKKSPSNVNSVLESSINLLKNKADFQNVVFAFDRDEALGNVMADPSRIQQVFLNLLINAADAMEGRGTLTVSTRSVSEGGMPFAEIEFTDTGPGIPPENVAMIFEPFFTTKPVGKGTGLGLAVSHGIVKEHEGSISVRSVPEEGTSFFVRLPMVI